LVQKFIPNQTVASEPTRKYQTSVNAASHNFGERQHILQGLQEYSRTFNANFGGEQSYLILLKSGDNAQNATPKGLPDGNDLIRQDGVCFHDRFLNF